MRRGLGGAVAVGLGLVVGLTAAGCGDGGSGGVVPAVAAPTFPVTVGGVSLAARPVRIVSLSPTATEMLFAVEAGPQVIAVDQRSDYPASAPKTTLSGTAPDIAAIMADRPDLVVLAADAGGIVAQLRARRIPVYLAPPAASLDDTYAQLTAIGALTGHPGPAAELVGDLRTRITALLAAVPPHNPLTAYVELDPADHPAGPTSFLGSLLAAVGVTDITGDQPLPAAAVARADPDLIFLADTVCCGQSADTVARRPGWSTITAVRTGQVIALDDRVAARWGPRVVDLVRAITTAVARAPVG